jgi:hypothetical protein
MSLAAIKRKRRLGVVFKVDGEFISMSNNLKLNLWSLLYLSNVNNNISDISLTQYTVYLLKYYK